MRRNLRIAFVSRGMDVTTTYGVHVDPFDNNHLTISYTDRGYHHSFDGARSVEGVRATCRFRLTPKIQSY